MLKANMSFQERVKTIESARNAQNSMSKRHRSRTYNVLRALTLQFVFLGILIYAGLTVTKVYMSRQLGNGGYDRYLARLEKGDETSRLGAKLLQPDPVSQIALGYLQVPQKVR